MLNIYMFCEHILLMTFINDHSDHLMAKKITCTIKELYLPPVVMGDVVVFPKVQSYINLIFHCLRTNSADIFFI